MSYWPEESLYRRDGVTVPKIGIAVALSLLLHAAVMWQWKFSPRAPGPDKDGKTPLTVHIERLPGPPLSPGADLAPAPPVPPRAAPPVAARPSQPKPRAAPPPPRPMTVPESPVAIAPVPAGTAPMRAPPAGDFASFVEAQRRARGEESAAPPAAPAATTTAAEDANARATRQAIANLATPRTPAMGQDPSRSGGVFQIRSKSSDYAEFMFNGWHSEARRNWAQLVEVRKGNHASIELAVVRQMIDIIRKYEQADFPWHSHRMNRTVTLSARPRDSAGLEEFLMREFFFNPRIAP